MYGELTEALIKAIRAYPCAQETGLVAILGNDTRGQAIVNTTIPCAVIIPVNDDPITFIGGRIYHRVKIEIAICIELINYSASEDNGTQARMTDMPNEVLMYLEKEMGDPMSPFFRHLRHKYGFEDIYKGMTTHTQQAFANNTSINLQVFSGSYIINLLEDRMNKGNEDEYPLEEVTIALQDTDMTTNMDFGAPQTTKIPHDDI